MDKRLFAIISVTIIELLFRALYGFVRIDPLTYTLLARTAELLVILLLALDMCGIRVKSIQRELALGLGLSIVFGLGVVLLDILSRLVIQGGVLHHLLGRMSFDSPLMFLIVGCIFAPFVEELFFRGLIYAWLRTHVPVAFAVLVTALLFALIHGKSLSPIGVLLSPQFIGGIIFALIYQWRNDIWPGYVVHVLGNLGVWLFPYYYPWI